MKKRSSLGVLRLKHFPKILNFAMRPIHVLRLLYFCYTPYKSASHVVISKYET